VKRDALGLPAPAQQKPAEKTSKAKAAPTKEAAKSKPSKSSERKENKPVPKTLPEALKLVWIVANVFSD
jgi:BRCT domain type II-containing protein